MLLAFGWTKEAFFLAWLVISWWSVVLCIQFRIRGNWKHVLYMPSKFFDSCCFLAAYNPPGSKSMASGGVIPPVRSNLSI